MIEINDSSIDSFWKILIFFYKWINIIIITYKFYITIKNLNTRENDIRNREDKIEERDYIKKSKYIMYSFPLILILLKFHTLIESILCIFKIYYDKNIFLFTKAICDSLIGFFNCIIFLSIHRKYF
jgi:hypothetical protein